MNEMPLVLILSCSGFLKQLFMKKRTGFLAVLWVYPRLMKSSSGHGSGLWIFQIVRLVQTSVAY